MNPKRGQSGLASRHLVTAVLIIVSITLITIWGQRPPRPVSSTETGFSADRAVELLAGLVGSGKPHPVGSPEHDRVRDFIVDRFRAFGYDPVVQTETITSGRWQTTARVENVMARLEGTRPDSAAMPGSQ